MRGVDLSGLVAVVGELAAPAARAPTAARLRAHDEVVRRVDARASALLPARFGQVADDEAALRALVGPRRGGLERALELVRGRAQMTLRVFGEPDPGASEEAPADPALGPGARYLVARRQAAARARDVPEARPVLAALRELVVATRVERVERPEAGAGLLASVYHLVPRGQAERYRALVEAHATSLAPRRVTVSGPWPAYAFAPG